MLAECGGIVDIAELELDIRSHIALKCDIKAVMLFLRSYLSAPVYLGSGGSEDTAILQ